MHEVQTVLEFAIASFTTSDEAVQGQLNEAVSEAKVLDNTNSAPSRIIDAGNVIESLISDANTVISTTAAWDPLLDKIRLFTEIVDGISEVWFECRRSPKSPHSHGLLDSRSIPMRKWHGPSCLLRTRYIDHL
jgi:hypothetical protein